MKMKNVLSVTVRFDEFRDRPKTAAGYAAILRKWADEMEKGNATAYATTHDDDGNFTPQAVITVNS
jgi:hypothetical protein